jgi:excisionase family DNA binding protein
MKNEASVPKPERDENSPALLDARAAAAYLVVNIETLYRTVRAGELPHTRAGRTLQFRQMDLDRYLEEQTTKYWQRGDGRKRKPRKPQTMEARRTVNFSRPNEEEVSMTKEELLAKRKLEWLKQERRDFIDAYLEEWESEGWLGEWDEKEDALREQWRAEHLDGTEADWDEWVNRQFVVWREERCEAVREEAQEKWEEQAAEYERQWKAYVKDNEGAWLKEFAQ